MNDREEGEPPAPGPAAAPAPRRVPRPLPALTPRIPRSRGATAGIHAAMPGRRDPPPEVAVSPDRRGDQDRKPPRWARPPPAARRPRAAGLGPRHTGACAQQGPALPLARATLRSLTAPCSTRKQVLPSLPRSTTQVPGPPVSVSHMPVPLVPYVELHSHSPPQSLHRQLGFSTEKFWVSLSRKWELGGGLKAKCHFQICVLERSLRLLRAGRTVGGWN